MGKKLFPAWAGVILDQAISGRRLRSFPRMGGGDPDIRILESALAVFSPHGRG